MKLVFDLDNVICTPPKGIKFGVIEYINNAKPIEDVAEFMAWCYDRHATEKWLELHSIKYHRLLLDKPDNPVYVNETPSHAKFYKHLGDLGIVAELYEEWKNDKIEREKDKH